MPLITPRCAVLQALRRSPSSYAAALRDDLLVASNKRIRLYDSSLYPALARLLRDGLVEEVETPEAGGVAPTASGSGRPAKHYRLTLTGRQEADADAAVLRGLAGEG